MPVRKALVTGAGSPNGIGFATARALGHLGYDVVVLSTTHRINERAEELRAAGHKAQGIVADLMNAESSKIAIDAHGPFDVLVNNAGMATLGQLDSTGLLEQQSTQSWELVLRRNLTTAFNAIRAVLPAMKVNGWGRIVNVSSTTGTVAGVAGDCAYAAAKAGLLGLTRSLSLEVASAGITVNAVAPGWIATGSQTESEARAGRATPMGRSGTPDEVAGLIAYLCSQGASYITGQLLVIDGGNSIVEDKQQ
jgi:3-oxoacyl-[acyl-carrier protein] reductase